MTNIRSKEVTHHTEFPVLRNGDSVNNSFQKNFSWRLQPMRYFLESDIICHSLGNEPTLFRYTRLAFIIFLLFFTMKSTMSVPI